MEARDIMTRPVISVGPDATLREVVDLLLQHRISGLPVVEDGQVVGVVGDGDLLHRHELGTEASDDGRSWWQRLLQDDPAPLHYVRAHGSHVRDVMDTRVVCVDERTPLARIARIFEQRHVRRVPVLRAGQLVGLVTRADLVRALAWSEPPQRASAPPPRLGDDEIRAQLLAELERHRWWHGGWANVYVERGVVRYVGFIQQAADRDAARIAAEQIPGVRAVVDQRSLYSELQPML